MGLLDEAIKQHLDLKRRRGADPEDVAREEREALGPAVREVRESMSGDEGPAPAVPTADGGEAVEVAPERAAEAATGVEEPDPAAQESPPAADPPPADSADEPPVDQATQVFDADDLFAAEDDALVPDPEAPPAGDDRPPADPDAVRPDPESPSSPPAEGAASPAEGEDVLEETPDFLQETPEHDRLWFEQKPPRDFDFDK